MAEDYMLNYFENIFNIFRSYKILCLCRMPLIIKAYADIFMKNYYACNLFQMIKKYIHIKES